MSNILEQICADKRLYLKEAKLAYPFETVHHIAIDAPPVRNFSRALRAAAERDGAGFITEIKRASPSAGLIREDFSPSALAKAYESAGAACLSVLTDAPYFQGRNEDLDEARKACTIPVLRKDFILDVWQVAEARAIGADCILLIMAVLSDADANELYAAARDYGMDVLVEVHDMDELERALKLSAFLVGVNSRNLKTMKIDLNDAAGLISALPPERFAISESGIHSSGDVAMMKRAGARGFLVGESLLKQQNVGSALKKIKG